MLLRNHLSRIECSCGETLAAGSARDAVAYFPESIVVGIGLSPHGSAVGLIGREGMVGWPGLLGPGERGHSARVLMGSGTALAIPVERLREACFVSPTLTLSLMGFVQAFALQISWSLLAARQDSLSQRICGLLLMIHDRVEGDEIPATHRALAAHLGVRRASITDTLHVLEGKRAVRSERGRVIIRDRTLVESLSGLSYSLGAGAGYSATARLEKSAGEDAGCRPGAGMVTLREQPTVNAQGGPSAGFA